MELVRQNNFLKLAARGKEGAWADRISNPHNQTLYVAIQWGLLGCIILYAIWYSHCLLFLAPGLVAWIGFTVVAQNFLSSLLNSHLFDFSEGWIYVLGVGVAGGFQFRSEASLLQGLDGKQTKFFHSAPGGACVSESSISN